MGMCPRKRRGLYRLWQGGVPSSGARVGHLSQSWAHSPPRGSSLRGAQRQAPLVLSPSPPLQRPCGGICRVLCRVATSGPVSFPVRSLGVIPPGGGSYQPGGKHEQEGMQKQQEWLLVPLAL